MHLTLDVSTFDASTSAVSTPAVPAPDLSGFDVSRKGSYGTLYLNSTTGAYTFVPDSHAINALTAPTTESFVITVSDGTLSASQTFTITINGTNDAANISGITAGSVIEACGYALHADRDRHASLPPTSTIRPTPSRRLARRRRAMRGYGTFTMTTDGIWTYTLNEANAAVQALNVGGTLTDTFTVTTEDGTPQSGDHLHRGHQRRGRHFRRHDRLSDRAGDPAATRRP